jgi:rod shape-determining protein MreD
MFEQKSLLNIALLHVVAVLLVMLNISDIKINGLIEVLPFFDLMAVFYFAVFQNIFALWFIFFLGLFNDALNGNPLGATSLSYIILVKLFILFNQKTMLRENFVQVWQQFIVFCVMFLLMKWLIISAFNSNFSSLIGIIFQMIISSLFYVPMHKFFDYLSDKLISNN